MDDDVQQAKQAAGKRAADLVEDGQVVGLGSGSTARRMVQALGRRVDAEDLDVVGVPTSEATAKAAREVGIPLTTLEDEPVIDLTLDGADEVDPDLQLIKGLGGALVREKIVAAASRRLVVLVDPRKLVDRLGERSRLPVEVVRFGHASTARRLAAIAPARLRRQDGEPFVTDNGNVIYDLDVGDGIPDPRKLAAELAAMPGVVDHGLFLDMAEAVVVGRSDGSAEMRRR